MGRDPSLEVNESEGHFWLPFRSVPSLPFSASSEDAISYLHSPESAQHRNIIGFDDEDEEPPPPGQTSESINLWGIHVLGFIDDESST